MTTKTIPIAIYILPTIIPVVNFRSDHSNSSYRTKKTRNEVINMLPTPKVNAERCSLVHMLSCYRTQGIVKQEFPIYFS